MVQLPHSGVQHYFRGLKLNFMHTCDLTILLLGIYATEMHQKTQEHSQ